MVQWFMNRRSKMKKLIAVLLLVGASTAMAYDNYMGQIIGGVAGGIIGNQVGGGSGKIVTTAIGAGIGAIVGGRVEDNMDYNRRDRYYDRDDRYRQSRIIYQQAPIIYRYPYGYHEETIFDGYCRCYRTVLVQN